MKKTQQNKNKNYNYYSIVHITRYSARNVFFFFFFSLKQRWFRYSLWQDVLEARQPIHKRNYSSRAAQQHDFLARNLHRCCLPNKRQYHIYVHVEYRVYVYLYIQIKSTYFPLFGLVLRRRICGIHYMYLRNEPCRVCVQHITMIHISIR